MLYLEKNGKDGWFEDPAAVIEGFPSKKSMETVTTGIDIWSKPFIMKNSKGEKIAVILVDTQGTNDNKAPESQFTRIFALSTLLSNIQVNNMRNEIGCDKIKQLQYFLEFAKYAVPSDSTQKLLIMLVRDWQSANKFGFAEGNFYWTDKVMQRTKGGENANLLKSIDTFMEVKCCLLPYPGEKMIEQEEFREPISDLSERFRKHVVELVTGLFNGNQAERKSSKEFRLWCHQLADRFKSKDLPEPRSIIAVEAERICVKARDCGLALFESTVEDELRATSGNCMSQEELQTLCSGAKATALELYDKERRGFDVKEIREGQREKLIQLLATKETFMFKSNETHLVNVNRIISEDILRTFDAMMASATQTALEETEFSATSKRNLDILSQQFLQKGTDAMRFYEQLECQMQEKTQDYRAKNERKLNKQSSKLAKKHYSNRLRELCKDPVTADDFDNKSGSILEESCSDVENKLTGSQKLKNDCLQELRVELAKITETYRKQNQENIKRQLEHKNEIDRLKSMESLKEAAKKHYEDELMELCQHSMTDDEFSNNASTLHKKSWDDVQKCFIGSEEMRDDCLEELHTQLAEITTRYRNINERSRQHEAEIQKLKNEMPSYAGGWHQYVSWGHSIAIAIAAAAGTTVAIVAGPVAAAIFTVSVVVAAKIGAAAETVAGAVAGMVKKQALK